MHQSIATLTEARQPGVATGYRSWFGSTRPIDLPFDRGNVGAGNIFSSAEDMARYLLAHLNGGSVRGQRILSSAGISELHHPAVAIGEGFYGMGWEISNAEAGATRSHVGTGANFWSKMVVAPDARSGIVLLTNARTLQYVPRLAALVDGIAALLHGAAPPVPSPNPLLLVYRIVMALAVLELAIVAWSLRMLLRRRSEAAPVSHPRWRLSLRFIGLLGFQLVVACFCLVVVPLLYTPSIVVAIPAMLAVDFDLGLAAVSGGSIALLWVLGGAALMLRKLRVTRRTASVARRTLIKA
jgi:hypothetical protein